MSPFRLKGVILLVSISIVSAIYVILFSPSYQEQDVNRLIQKPLYEKYKINNIVLDVSLANHELSSELLDYIHNSHSIKNSLSFYITPTSPSNKIEEITINFYLNQY